MDEIAPYRGRRNDYLALSEYWARRAQAAEARAEEFERRAAEDSRRMTVAIDQAEARAKEAEQERDRYREGWLLRGRLINEMRSEGGSHPAGEEAVEADLSRGEDAERGGKDG